MHTPPHICVFHIHLCAENGEQVTASKVLANFKLAYAALIDEYNNSPEVRNNTNDGITLFLSKRDALVQETRTMLNGALTPQGMANFHANIQQEKANMKIAASEVARGQQ